MALEDVLGKIPGLAGYLGRQEFDQKQMFSQLQQASGAVTLANALKKRQLDEQFRREVAALGPGASPEEYGKVGLRYGQPEGLIRGADEYQKIVEARKSREAMQQGLERIMGGSRAPTAAPSPIAPDVQETQQAADQGLPAPQPQTPAAAPSGVRDVSARLDQLKQLSMLYASNPAAVTAINREIDKLEAPSKDQPSVHVTQDKTSPTGWSYTDVKTDKILSKGAPPPSTSIDTGNLETNAKAIAEYRLPPYTGFSMRNPGARETMAKVMELNPNYDAKNYVTAQRTRNSFAVGVEGRTVRSFNVAIDHLDTLKDAADALKNNDIQRFNQLSQRIAQETGSAAPTNFDAIKGIVAKEIVKSVVGNAQGGGVTERQELSQDMSRANSPQQLSGMIDKYHTLMAGQLKGLKQQYEAGLGGDNFDSFLLPRSREIFSKAQRGATPGGWTPEKEQRYQELLRKRGGS